MASAAAGQDDELESIDYGYDGSSLDAGLVLSAEGDLLRSTGQAVAPANWSMEAGAV
jgi:hypothetical protein